MVAEITMNELEQLVLALGEHLSLRSRGDLWDLPVCSTNVLVRRQQTVKCYLIDKAIPSLMHG
jgi:hypothetical protein